VILKQTCLSQELITNKNGEVTAVFVVVKHSPFIIQIGLHHEANQPPFDLARLSFEARLCYDSADQKEVVLVKLKPLEYKVKSDELENRVNIECRLKVLSSHMEDMFFRLRFHALDPLTKREFSHLTVTSGPIKVISKPEQLRSKLPPSNKRKANELYYSSLERIQMQQVNLQPLLEKLEQKVISLSQKEKQEKQEIPIENNKIKDSTLESCFQDLLTAYENLKPDQRPKKIRSALQQERMSSEVVSEIVDLFVSEGLQKPIGNQVGSSPSDFHPFEECNCSGCPHKEQYQRVSNFYFPELKL